MSWIKKNLKVIVPILAVLLLIMVIKQGCKISDQDEIIKYIDKKSKKDVRVLKEAVKKNDKLYSLKMKKIQEEYSLLHKDYDNSENIIANLSKKNKSIKVRQTKDLVKLKASYGDIVANCERLELKYGLQGNELDESKKQVFTLKIVMQNKDEEIGLLKASRYKLRLLVKEQVDRISFLEKLKRRKLSILSVTGGYTFNSHGSGVGGCIGVDLLNFLKAIKVLR